MTTNIEAKYKTTILPLILNRIMYYPTMIRLPNLEKTLFIKKNSTKSIVVTTSVADYM